ncbi:unnamed protein product, partial [Ectocarpus sp. 12 AP-2014]
MPTVQSRHQGTRGRGHRSREHGRHPTGSRRDFPRCQAEVRRTGESVLLLELGGE